MSALHRRLAALERAPCRAAMLPCACPWPLSHSEEHFVLGLWIKRETAEALSDEEIAEEDRLMSLHCKCPRLPVSKSAEDLLIDARRLGMVA